MCKSDDNSSRTIRTEMNLVNEEEKDDDHNERIDDFPSTLHNEMMEGYYPYNGIISFKPVPHADPQEESSGCIKRPSPEPAAFGEPVIWALFVQSFAVVFGILAGIFAELSNDSSSLQERENAIFYAQMLGGTSIALSTIAIRLLARVAREHQFKRLSRGRPMYRKATWISLVFGIVYCLGYGEFSL
ncbi:unnamed protein product [Cylindrotheca closterium]|uniref:Uncharacterized protein n=1 Tax=Cylindrotheca closterium TaxID=2856 RepID=A0AAD2PXL9_9STRA|nr:unnamed protein product [Cylindrotheca closterium]